MKKLEDKIIEEFEQYCADKNLSIMRGHIAFLRQQIPVIQEEAVRKAINNNSLEDYLCSCPKCFSSHHINKETQLAIINDLQPKAGEEEKE